MQSYISKAPRPLLTGEAPHASARRFAGGTYEARKQSSGRGGNGGESYQIAVSSLPQEAQILYYAQCDNAAGGEDCDLAAYHARFGEKGIQELLGQAAGRPAGPRDPRDKSTG